MEKVVRNTRQRQVVLEELCRHTSHPTAAELYEVVRRRLPRISLGTVYRNLELLSRRGVIRKLETSGSQTRFDGDTRRHYHVRCAACGRLDDVHDAPEDLVMGRVGRLGGHEILGLRVDFVGVCPECRQRVPPEELAGLRRDWQ